MMPSQVGDTELFVQVSPVAGDQLVVGASSWVG